MFLTPCACTEDGAGEPVFGEVRVEAPYSHSQSAGLLDRLRICIFCGLPVPTCACATRLQARVRARTHAVQNRPLVQTHWGFCTQQEKEKQERIFLLWFSLCSLIPSRRAMGTQMQHLGPERAPRLLPTAPTLSPPLTTNPGPRAQHQPETSWNSSVSGRIRKH